jgi:hypothetical protein
MADEPPYDVEFYDEPSGAYPVYDWITNELSPTLRRTIGVAMGEILQYMGVEVCETEWGKPLGGGLYEFRVRHDYDEIMGRRRPLYKRVYPKEKVLLRVFFHPYGEKVLLLVGGYDKSRFPGRRRQQQQIEIARRRLREWKGRQA